MKNLAGKLQNDRKMVAVQDMHSWNKKTGKYPVLKPWAEQISKDVPTLRKRLQTKLQQ